MTIYTKITIAGTTYYNANWIDVIKNVSDNDSTSKFYCEFPNDAGQYDDTFNLNDEVIIYADVDTNPPTTNIFLGVIEEIKFAGYEKEERVQLKGRDYGCILQDILVSPRIFKNQEVSSIVRTLMIQNATGTGITTNNVDVTVTTIDRITFNNISLFDAITRLAEIAGYYFYIDTDKDLHFEIDAGTSSGLTFDNTNVLSAKVTNNDSDIFNKITVYGDRQLTGAQEVFGPQAGSVYTLDDKPSNAVVTGSASPNIILQPGGILYVNDPETEDVKWLLDYNYQQIILTSGITAGDNTGWIGSTAVIIDYQRSSPLVSIRQDITSQTTYGIKHKIIVDRNIKDIYEANTRANTFLASHKDPTVEVDLDIYGVVSLTPGNTAVVNIPFHNINNQTYTITTSEYNFNNKNNLSNDVLKVILNKRITNFVDIMKEQELRLRALEGSEVDTSITDVVTSIGSTSVTSSGIVVSRSIGSAFYFHTPGHNLFNSSTSLLGDMRAGSTIGGLT